MKTTLKSWTALGLGVALVGAAACGRGGEGEGTAVAAAPEAHGASHAAGEGEGEGEGEGATTAMTALPVAHRVAFMSGHVAAGLALVRAGAADQAAPHLTHPVSETHADERAGIDALGFDQSIFLGLSKALEEGNPIGELEPQLKAAEANMALLREKAGGDPASTISYLMDTVFEEYRVGVTDGAITNAGEYQDAFGFAVVARETAKRIEGKDTGALIAELDKLVAMWPAAPLAASTPTPVSDVAAQTSKVQLALSGMSR